MRKISVSLLFILANFQAFAGSPEATLLANRLAEQTCVTNPNGSKNCSMKIFEDAVPHFISMLDEHCSREELIKLASDQKLTDGEFAKFSIRCQAISTADNDACTNRDKAMLPCSTLMGSNGARAAASAALFDKSVDVRQLQDQMIEACSDSEISAIRRTSRFILIIFRPWYLHSQELTEKCQAVLPDSIKNHIITSRYVASKFAVDFNPNQSPQFSVQKFAKAIDTYCNEQDQDGLIEDIDYRSRHTQEFINTQMSEKCRVLVSASSANSDVRAQQIAVLDDTGMPLSEAAQLIRSNCDSNELDAASKEVAFIVAFDTPRYDGEFRLKVFSEKCLAHLPRKIAERF